MTQENFMTDYFYDDEVVKVKAVELQKLLKNYEERKKDCEILSCRIDILETLLEIEKTRNKVEEFIPIVDLKA